MSSLILGILLAIVVWYGIKIYSAIHRAQRRAGDIFNRFNSEAQEASRHNRKGGWSAPQATRSKKIDHTVGEYVEFEEVTESSSHKSDGSRQTETYIKESQITDAEWEDI